MLVRYASNPGVDHERIAGWPIDDGAWIVATPHLLLHEEPTATWSRVLDVTGTDVYPEDVEEVESFSRPLEDFEIADLVARARDEAKRLRDAGGRSLPTTILVRRGHLRGVAEPVAPAPPALPVAGAEAGHAAGAAAGAVVDVERLPGVLVPPIGPGRRVGTPGALGAPVGALGARGAAGVGDPPAPDRGPGPELPLADGGADRPRGGGVGLDAVDPLAAAAGHVWLTSDFAFGALGIEVTMGRGCVAIGMKGVYMDGGGTTGFVEQVAIERVPGYVEALRRAYG